MTTEILSRNQSGAMPADELQTAVRWAPLAVLLAGTFMAVLDFFIVNVALPSMQSSLRAAPSSIEWVVAGYALSSSTLLVAGGRLGDRYGRRLMFVVGLALFTASSALCGVAPTTTALVIGRLLQGLGGALFTTNVIAMIGVLYAGSDRPKAMTAYAMVMGVAAVGGQLIGGGLLATDPFGLGWRCCFLINLPIGLAALIVAPRLVPETRGKAVAGLDLLGVALITAALTATVLPLVQGRQAGWAAWVWITLAAAPLLLALFVVQQRALARAGRTPLVQLELFALRSFRAGLIAQTLFWSGQASFFLILALYLQTGRDLTPMRAGLVFTALAGSYLVASMRSPGLAYRHGRSVITAAAMTLIVGHAILIGSALAIGTTGSVLWLLPGLMIVGVGMGLGIAPLATNLLASLRPAQAGAASAALSTAQYVGNSLGVAVVGAVFFGALRHGYPYAFEHGLIVLLIVLAFVAGLSRLLPRSQS